MRNRIAAGIVLLIFGISPAGARSYSCALIFPDGEVAYPWLAAGGATAWQKNSDITLFIVSPSGAEFTFQQTNDIQAALSNWSTTAGTNLSITTSVVTSTPSSFPAQYILVQFGDTSACGAGESACTAFHYNTTTGYPTYSTINVDSSVGTNSIAPLMAHEMGHTYIIADCRDENGCSSSSLTIMDPDELTDTSPTSPQCCDLDLIYDVTPTDRQGAYCSQ